MSATAPNDDALRPPGPAESAAATPRVRRARTLATAVLPILAVLGIVWLPEWLHWYVPTPSIADTVLQSARTAPSDEVLDEIGMMSLSAADSNEGTGSTLALAKEILQGRVKLPGYETTTIARPLSLQDLQRGPETMQLMLASLATTDLLLDAYRLSGDERYFEQAREDIVAFARYESAQWLNAGFLWNDHAISARIPVLVKFWRIYRGRADFDPAVGQLVLALLQRSGRLLTRDSHYAFRTGHGIISDLAAMQLSLAFPALDAKHRIGEHARARFAHHLQYYVSSEGITLMHSAGYHGSGLKYFGVALRLHTLASVPITADWWQRYENAIDYYAKLRRPDGTLPMYGDTRSISEGAGPFITARGQGNQALPLRARTDWPAAASFDVYPLAGHALWWDHASGEADAAPRTQTTLTWSYFPGLGHKLADELSLLAWSDGKPWITNVGYWPWGFWGRREATSWPGSNAPHLADERAESPRVAHIAAAASHPQLMFADLRRDGPDGFQVRRQVARLPERELWLVLDETCGATGTTETHWTFAPHLVAARPDARLVRIVDTETGRAMMMSFDGSPQLQADVLIGSRAPFGGWVVVNREPAPAPTVVLRQSAGGWTLASFALDPLSETGGARARMLRWQDAEHWTVVVDSLAGGIELQRNGTRLILNDATEVALAPAAFPAAARQRVLATLGDAHARYPRFAERVSFRWRVTRWIVAAWAMQEALALAMRRWRPRTLPPLRALGALAWLTTGVWLGFVYFEGMWC